MTANSSFTSLSTLTKSFSSLVKSFLASPGDLQSSSISQLSLCFFVQNILHHVAQPLKFGHSFFHFLLFLLTKPSLQVEMLEFSRRTKGLFIYLMIRGGGGGESANISLFITVGGGGGFSQYITLYNKRRGCYH